MGIYEWRLCGINFAYLTENHIFIYLKPKQNENSKPKFQRNFKKR